MQMGADAVDNNCCVCDEREKEREREREERGERREERECCGELLNSPNWISAV